MIIDRKEKKKKDTNELINMLYNNVIEVDIKSKYKNKLKTIISRYIPANKVSTNVEMLIIVNDRLFKTA